MYSLLAPEQTAGACKVSVTVCRTIKQSDQPTEYHFLRHRLSDLYLSVSTVPAVPSWTLQERMLAHHLTACRNYVLQKVSRRQPRLEILRAPEQPARRHEVSIKVCMTSKLPDRPNESRGDCVLQNPHVSRRQLQLVILKDIEGPLTGLTNPVDKFIALAILGRLLIGTKCECMYCMDRYTPSGQ